jgi:hypothetical protein
MGVNMLRYILTTIIVWFVFGCTPKEVLQIQTFSPRMIDLQKVDEESYDELIAAVNETYAPDTKEFVDARLWKEESHFMYFRIYSSKSTACYRVTIDRNRSKIVNMQPDCPIEE